MPVNFNNGIKLIYFLVKFKILNERRDFKPLLEMICTPYLIPRENSHQSSLILKL